MPEFIDVEWLTESDMFKKNITLVAGHQGLKRRVTYVTVQEAPNFYEQIEGGEFVLSAWYAFKDDIEAGVTAIRNLSGKASGLCIKINRFINYIPQEYIDCANELGLPLFTVEPDIKFRDIIRSITLEISSALTNILLDLKDYYAYLFKAALENGSADMMLADFSKRTGLVAITISTDCRQIRGIHSFVRLPDCEHRLNVVKNIIRQNMDKLQPFSQNEYHVFPCVARGYCYGYFVVLSAETLSERQRLYITQLINIITIKWLDRQEKENDSMQLLLEMLCEDPVKNEKQILTILNSKSIDQASGIRIVHLKLNTMTKHNGKINLSSFQRFLLDMMAIKSNIIYIWDKAYNFEMLVDNQNSVGETFVKRLQELSASYRDILISVGPSVDSIPLIRESLRIAINAQLFLSEGSNYVYYKDYLMQLAICGGVGSYESDRFVKEMISPISAYDRTYNDCVLTTLLNVVKTGNIDEVAREHNMHPNTIRYRLQKIKKIIDFNFFNEGDKYVLTTACMLYEHQKQYKIIFRGLRP